MSDSKRAEAARRASSFCASAIDACTDDGLSEHYAEEMGELYDMFLEEVNAIAERLAEAGK